MGQALAICEDVLNVQCACVSVSVLTLPSIMCGSLTLFHELARVLEVYAGLLEIT